jgi:glyoxylase-like metal-dependent hydrolase (beta-lactamase superfamily II)
MALRNRTLNLGPLDNNTYLLTCPVTRETAVVDVGFEPEAVIDLVRREKLRVRWLLGTHAHYDHAAGMLAVQQAVGGEYALHPLERPLLEVLSMQGSMFGFPPAEPAEVEHELVDRETLRIGEEEIEVLFTPGHSPGHCSFRQGPIVWVGDVLFNGSVGRTDLPGSSFATLVRSIHDRLFTLDDDVTCLTGHGPATTIGHERRFNPFVGEPAGYR